MGRDSSSPFLLAPARLRGATDDPILKLTGSPLPAPKSRPRPLPASSRPSTNGLAGLQASPASSLVGPQFILGGFHLPGFVLCLGGLGSLPDSLGRLSSPAPPTVGPSNPTASGSGPQRPAPLRERPRRSRRPRRPAPLRERLRRPRRPAPLKGYLDGLASTSAAPYPPSDGARSSPTPDRTERTCHLTHAARQRSSYPLFCTRTRWDRTHLPSNPRPQLYWAIPAT